MIFWSISSLETLSVEVTMLVAQMKRWYKMEQETTVRPNQTKLLTSRSQNEKQNTWSRGTFTEEVIHLNKNLRGAFFYAPKSCSKTILFWHLFLTFWQKKNLSSVVIAIAIAVTSNCFPAGIKIEVTEQFIIWLSAVLSSLLWCFAKSHLTASNCRRSLQQQKTSQM